MTSSFGPFYDTERQLYFLECFFPPCLKVSAHISASVGRFITTVTEEDCRLKSEMVEDFFSFWLNHLDIELYKIV